MDNKNIKKPLKIILIIFLAFVLILAGLIIFHRIKNGSDIKYLTEKGYYNPVSIGDCSLNVVKFGNENSDRKIVVLSGMGSGLSVDMRPMTKELEDDYMFIFIGRAGWDGSDDKKDERSVETIVEEYRSALKASGLEGPYTLMAHSMGSVYASYWVSKYPEEIDAFINNLKQILKEE